MKYLFSLLLLFILFTSIPISSQQDYIDKWGSTSQGRNWAILNDSDFIAGNGSMGGPTPIPGGSPGWATIRGGFGHDMPIKKDEYLTVSGEIEFIGTIGGGDTYIPLRYALTYHENDSLLYPLTDSASWTSTIASGYGFHPRTGTGTMSNGIGGTGTVWTINNGSWNSNYSNNGGPIAVVNQAPRNAVLIPGRYFFAIGIRQIDETTNEIKWYLVEEWNRYWFGGTVVDSATTNKFNAINFGVSTGDWAQVNIIAAKVDYGEVPYGGNDFKYYVHDWGFFTGKSGGWTMNNYDKFGNVSIKGTKPNTDWCIIRGEFKLVETYYHSLKITGKIEFEGDGFHEPESFRIGLFYTEAAGGLLKDTVNPNNLYWTGTDDNASGYLFIPQSGSNGSIDWNGVQGTWGAVIDTTWFIPFGYALGNEIPNISTGGEGEYEFEISVSPLGDGTSLVKFNMKNDNFNWILSAVDNHVPLVTDKFNSIAFALNSGNNITALNITDAKIDTGTIVNVENIDENIQKSFILHQNYPNPFNPATTINWQSPVSGWQTLKVYDILGNEIATLVNEEKPAGNYTIKFDGSNLSSGVYFLQLTPGESSITKKMILLK